jgi:hypothetical protein
MSDVTGVNTESWAQLREEMVSGRRFSVNWGCARTVRVSFDIAAAYT